MGWPTKPTVVIRTAALRRAPRLAILGVRPPSAAASSAAVGVAGRLSLRRRRRLGRAALHLGDARARHPPQHRVLILVLTLVVVVVVAAAAAALLLDR